MSKPLSKPLNHRFGVTFTGDPSTTSEHQAGATVDVSGLSLPIAMIDKIAVTLKAIDLACELAGNDEEQLTSLIEPAGEIIVAAHRFLGLEDIYDLGSGADCLSDIVATFRAGPDAEPGSGDALDFPTLVNPVNRTGNA